MRIEDAKVIVCSPGRNFVTLKITTADGVTGIGDATLNGREMAVVAYLQEHVIPLLIGRDARRIEDTWQLLYRGAYWRRGPVTMRAIAAVDVALWDIKAKAAGLPLYDLLGGKSREGVLVYGHQRRGHRVHLRRGRALCGAGLQGGARAERHPGARQALRRLQGRHVLRAGRRHAADRDDLEHAEVPRSHPQAVRQAARARRVGFDVELLHDAHHRLTPIEAARLGKSLEPYRLFWLEDLTPAENQEAFRLIRQHTVTPLAVGRGVPTPSGTPRTCCRKQLVDYIRATVVGAGGITHLRRIADFAAVWQVRTGCHGATDLSPVTMGAALHFDSWVPNFGIQEYMRHTPQTDEVFPHAYRFEGGLLFPGDAPGHGVTLDEALAAKYPYDPKQLPIARLEDGTMWNW